MEAAISYAACASLLPLAIRAANDRASLKLKAAFAAKISIRSASAFSLNVGIFIFFHLAELAVCSACDDELRIMIIIEVCNGAGGKSIGYVGWGC